MATTVETIEYDQKGRVVKRTITTTPDPRPLPYVQPLPYRWNETSPFGGTQIWCSTVDR